ncbi:MAG: YggS family pyridoxal phosphate-dependent enzyme [Anaerolineae bacterium]|nr:YggS family pyridoxal phosphate-dependent enzyme [Anaerolineae bacterium]MDW8172424.1 YggS family pyridoxal phosphate-dependent enzyme [Anaerolineae bacterium]
MTLIDSAAIAHNIEQVQAHIAEACQRTGRSIDDVTLVAVSKFQPPEAVLAALEAGVTHFGENRAEDALEKIAQVAQRTSKPITWHMIGHVQSRKAKLIYPAFSLVHSVDSLKLAQKLARQAQEMGRPARILLEVNVSGESSKEGFPAYDWQHNPATQHELWRSLEAILAVPNVQVEGLMTMAPYEAKPEATRPVFRSLAALRERLAQDFGQPFATLSMGMTNDYAIAIEEGATLVRVGRAIFGERVYQTH